MKGGLSICLLAAAAWLAARGFDMEQFRIALSALSGSALLTVSLALLLSSAFAALRLRSIAAGFGYALSARESVAVLSLGQLGGVLFFQIFGQLVARGSYLSRREVPFAGTVLITMQERIAAASVSLCLATVGAAYLFGTLTFDLASGGADMVRLGLGLAVALSAPCWIWQDKLFDATRSLTRRDISRICKSIAFSAVVQIWMMAAYIIVAHALAPDIALTKLAAAISLVMFAASIPISFAGWGVREMSAVAALGAIGMPSALAITVAVLIGVLSIACAGLLSMSALTREPKVVRVEPAASELRFVHSDILRKALPVLVATLVFFQIHVPTETSTLNVNLADPFAILAGVLFLLSARHAAPVWRLSYFNLHIVACSVAMLAALLIGASRIGWTDWAVTNRFLGWFVLLAYGATGALAARFDLTRVLDTFVGVGSAVVAFQIVDLILTILGVTSATVFAGFAQNPNAFAFQCLMLLCAALATQQRFCIPIVLSLVGIWLSGSRAGAGSAVVVMAASLVFQRAHWRSAVREVLAAAGVLAALAVVASLSQSSHPAMASLIVRLATDQSSNSEHLMIALDALRMFTDTPVFGAGLGVFIAQWKGPYPLVIHSSVLWLLAEFGVIGAMIFMVPAVRMFLAEMPRPRGTAGSLIVFVMIAFGSISLFHELLYQRTMWLLLGAALAISAATAKPNPETPDST